MRRRVVAAAWVAGATLPLLLGALFIAGCCVLPFHGAIHKVVPLCHIAAKVMSGDMPQQDPAPAQQKQEPVKRMKTTLSPMYRLAVAHTARLMPPAPETSYRSFISLGAVRCDQDVGLHVLVDTFRI
jgi:hypothetical protein